MGEFAIEMLEDPMVDSVGRLIFHVAEFLFPRARVENYSELKKKQRKTPSSTDENSVAMGSCFVCSSSSSNSYHFSPKPSRMGH